LQDYIDDFELILIKQYVEQLQAESIQTRAQTAFALARRCA
jgi:hypothetical protein